MFYFDDKNKILTMENEVLRREIRFEKNCPVQSVLTRLSTGYQWQEDGEEPLLPLPSFDWDACRMSVEKDRVIFEAGYRAEWIFRLTDREIGTRLLLSGHFPETGEMFPFETVGHRGRYLKLTAVSFRDQTDRWDTLVQKQEFFLYRKVYEGIRGNVFLLCDDTVDEALVMVKAYPIAEACVTDGGYDFRGDYSKVQIVSGLPRGQEDFLSHEVILTLCQKGEEAHSVRRILRGDDPGRYIMSNTWGDRSRDTALNEAFLLRELDTAQMLGVDVLQIDDGWQTGRTANSGLAKGGLWNEGFYRDGSSFWEPDPVKFPNGFEVISRYAREKGIMLGLWFSPDASNDYENWERDASTLIDLNRRFGVSYFKLDGIEIRSPLAEKRFAEFTLRVRRACGGKIRFNLDVTAGKRPGYFTLRDIGSIFLENRYTDWGNYYPHNTLRNLWDLCEYIPAERLQMEVLNLRRNREKYLLCNGSSDPLAPGGYDADYVFASVLCACPLLWMEMQNLSKEDQKTLTEIIRVFRTVRADFREVIPWGSRPDGHSLTGFYIRGEKQDYCVILREDSENEEANLSLGDILYTNDRDLQVKPGSIIFSARRRYVFAVVLS